MSFSEEVKAELNKQIPSARHCQMAEMAGYIWYIGQKEDSDYGVLPSFSTENENLKRKCFTLVKKLFNINKCNETFLVKRDIESLELLLKKSCCKRAFLRSAFVCNGSLTDPSKAYHMEFVLKTLEESELIQRLWMDFDIDAHITSRKDRYVVYIKDSSKIVDALNIMEAPVSLMNMENQRILKEVRNGINRRVNCEAANITKTVNASSRQVEDIRYILETKGLDYLPLPLRQMAEVRLENPDAPLKDLGELLDPKVGKSGVNHRLRKISEISDAIRNGL